MITPGKAVPLKDSVIFKMLSIVEMDFIEADLVDIYNATKSKFDCIDEFLYSIDVLYILNKLDVDFKSGVVKKC